MNDTILTPRQRYILSSIDQSDGLVREKIQELIKNTYAVSKPTLIRDLNILLRLQLIKSSGRARATKYRSFSTNPLLRVFDMKRYFEVDSDNREGVKKSFDFKVFEYFHDFYSEEENKILQQCSSSFHEATIALSPDILRRELERFVIELAWKSSKIEGNTYSLLETESLIKEQKEAHGKTKEEATMILNHKTAFETIVHNPTEFKLLTVSKINQLHNVLVQGLNVSTGIRKQAVGITGTVYRPLDNEHQIREALEKLVLIINNTRSAFEKALIAHSMVAYIQPYADGNKRTARMLTNAILLAYDLYPLSYRSVDEDEFKKALIVFYEQGSLVEIKRLFIEQVKFANETYFR